jgi:hypothetical protein
MRNPGSALDSITGMMSVPERVEPPSADVVTSAFDPAIGDMLSRLGPCR